MLSRINNANVLVNLCDEYQLMDKEPYFADFRVHVLEHIKIIEQQEFESHTTEWFLLRYLNRLARCANPPSRRGEVENAIRALVRFYVDNLDERSDLGSRCQTIYNEYRKCLRTQQMKS